MARTPKSPIKDPGRIGADVFIRDPDDATIQYKARTLSINYETKEADIGLFPRRWGQFSELHLPAEYRITVPLTELSLEPFAGTQQFGFEDVMIQRGEKPPPWTDNAGHVHQPGCEEPVAAAATTAPSTVIGEGGVPEPEFQAAYKAVAEVFPNGIAPPAEKPAAPPANAGVKVAAVENPPPLPRSAGKFPLFTKREILDQLSKLQQMVEASL